MCPYGPFEWGGRVSCSKLAFLGSVWVQVVEQEELESHLWGSKRRRLFSRWNKTKQKNPRLVWLSQVPWLLEVAAQGLCSASGSFRGDPETGLIQLQAAVLAGGVIRHGDRADRWTEERSRAFQADLRERHCYQAEIHKGGWKTGWGDNHHALLEARKKAGTCLKGFADSWGNER